MNLFADSSRPAADEIITPILNAPGVRIERIVSHGYASPEGFWYDQDEHEWVLVLEGAARLRFEGDAMPVALAAGDHVRIPAHRRHRVEWTRPDGPTVWLAVFHSAAAAPGP